MLEFLTLCVASFKAFILLKIKKVMLTVVNIWVKPYIISAEYFLMSLLPLSSYDFTSFISIFEAFKQFYIKLLQFSMLKRFPLLGNSYNCCLYFLD